MATLRDVARLSGVDASTASRVLNGGNVRVSNSTRTRIERAARELNYVPSAFARGLRLNRCGAIAMSVHSTENYIFADCLRGAEEAATSLGVSLYLLKQPDEKGVDRLLSVIRERRMDGWIFADVPPGDEFFQNLDETSVPYVSLDRRKAGPGPFVALPDEAGFRLQADAIVARGHRRIAFVGNEPENFVSRQCRNNFLKGMANHWLTVPPSHILAGSFMGNDADRLAGEIVRLRPRPTAVACASMMSALRLIQALKDRGLSVPNDIGVVGYHDSFLALSSRPPLSTIRMPSYAQGFRAVQVLMELASGRKAGYQGEIVLQRPEYIDRASLIEIA